MKDDKLVQLVMEECSEGIEVFLDSDSTPYATVWMKDHYETHAINSQEFRRWLRARIFDKLGLVCTSKALNECIDQLSGVAQIKGVVIRVSVRVAEDGENFLIDRGDEKWTCIEVAPHGHSILDKAPESIRFRRAPGTKPLPAPEQGGNLDLLREKLNLDSDYQWYLVVPWMLSTLRPKGPYSILVVNGGPGSGKSTFTQMLRDLLDPNLAALRSIPRSERDAFIAASNAHLFAVDNVSFMPDKMSDVYCRLSTGGGFSTRMLRTDDREKIFDVCKPALFNGIQEFCLRSDFGDRAIQITLPRIPEAKRRRSHELLEEFARDKGRIFGAMLETLSRTLKELPNVHLTNSPRMADWAHFAVGVERAMKWPDGTVLAAYDQMQKRSNETLLESWPFSSVIIELAKSGWSGTATALLDHIETKVTDTIWHRNLPKSPVQLSGTLRRLSPAFASRGIEVCCDGKTAGSGSRRFIEITTFGQAVPDPFEKKSTLHPLVTKHIHNMERAKQ